MYLYYPQLDNYYVYYNDFFTKSWFHINQKKELEKKLLKQNFMHEYYMKKHEIQMLKHEILMREHDINVLKNLYHSKFHDFILDNESNILNFTYTNEDMPAVAIFCISIFLLIICFSISNKK